MNNALDSFSLTALERFKPFPAQALTPEKLVARDFFRALLPCAGHFLVPGFRASRQG